MDDKPIGEQIWKTTMKSMGITLVVLFIGLVGLILYTFIFEVCKMHYFVTQSTFFTAILMLLGIFLAFNICFNHLMSALTPAGGTLHLKNLMPASRELAGVVVHQGNGDDSDDEDLEANPLPYRAKKCRKCHNFKPLRAHHCSLCDSCVLRMDHHCPWINNCVGHYNQRYFLLMIFYVLVATFFYIILSLPIFFGSEYEKYKAERSGWFNVVFFVSLALFIMMIPFNAWNWFLAFTGQTTIEFWMRDSGNRSRRREDSDTNDSILDFRQPSRIRNLEYIFGTVNVFRILLPSIRKQQHEGVNWENYINRNRLLR